MIPLIVSLLLVLLLGVGGTIAYLITHTDPVENTFTPSQIGLDIVEEFPDSEVKKAVQIKNTGDVDAYIRVAVNVTWVKVPTETGASSNIVTAKTPVAGEDYTISYANEAADAWIHGADGFWYYAKPVAANGLTPILISSCQPIQGRAPEGYTLSVEIIASAIQADPAQAVAGSWSNSLITVAVGTDRTLTITKKEAA